MLSNRQLFLKHLGQTSEFPLLTEIQHADGVYLFTPDGRKIIDLISGIGVSNLGHNHPAIIKAVKEQVDRHMHVMVYGEFVQSPQVQLAKALCDTLPANLDNVFFVNSGSEATEGALKLAKRFTGRPEIISCVNAYHGSSHGALSVGGNELLKQNFRPLVPGVRHIHFNSLDDLDKINEKTAAVIMETIQGEAGVRIPDEGYLKEVQQRCDETGALLILDEIQVGFGRTGTFWAFEQFGIIPDILLTAKSMGGGMPIGAFISSKDIMHSLTHDPILGHITTFGGHPVSAAASLANIREIKTSGILDTVEKKSDLIYQSLGGNSKVVEIRRKGLMMAVEFESFDLLQKILQKLLNKGVLSDWFLFCDNSMRIAPPLIINEKEIEEACFRIIETLDEC